MRIAYPFELQGQDGLYRLTCPTIPEVAGAARSRAKARAAARASLATTLSACVKERRDLPRLGKTKLAAALEPPVLLAAKLALYQTMRDANMSNMALARQMRAVEGTVRRLLDPYHRSHIEHVEAALQTLNKRLLLELRDA